MSNGLLSVLLLPRILPSLLACFLVELNALSCIFVAEGRWRWRRRTTTPLRPLPRPHPNSTTMTTVSRASSHSTTTPGGPRNPTMTPTTTLPRPLLRRRPAVLTPKKSAAACAFTMSEAPSPSSYRCSFSPARQLHARVSSPCQTSRSRLSFASSQPLSTRECRPVASCIRVSGYALRLR